MITRPDRPPVDPLLPAPERAANDDGGGVGTRKRGESGWDPYEVWARLVRDPRGSGRRVRT